MKQREHEDKILRKPIKAAVFFRVMKAYERA